MLQIVPRAATAAAQQLFMTQLHEAIEQLGAPIRALSLLDGSWVDTGAACQFAHDPDEIRTTGTCPATQIDRPEGGIAAVDEEAARRRSVCDDSVGADAEQGMRVLLVRRDPAAGISAPTEFRECLIESLGERGRTELGVEVHGRGRMASPTPTLGDPCVQCSRDPFDDSE